MPVEKDQDERVWCPGLLPWQWFDTCIEKRHKWCYSFSWLKRTGYGIVIHFEACEAGTLFTWNEGGFGIGDMGTEVPAGAMCFDSPRSSKGPCDASNTGLASAPLTADQQQADWRYCRRCHVMFFDGYRDKGVCLQLKLIVVGTPAELLREGRNLVVVALVGSDLHIRVFDESGRMFVDKAEPELVGGDALTHLKELVYRFPEHAPRFYEDTQRIFQDVVTITGITPLGGHVAQGFNFALPHDAAASEWAQREWRYCQRCHAMFFDGYPNKGVCPAGAGHSAQGFNFVLSHDVPASESRQREWRYCRKCHAIFFNGYSNKGICPSGGSHAAQGFDFVLPHA